MPEDFHLTAEISLSTKVLIVDDIGDWTCLLIDQIISRGFEVYYTGKLTRKDLDYLLHKKNFVYLENVEENFEEKFDYVYFFPHDNLERLNLVFTLAKKTSAKLLAGIFLGFSEREKLEEMVELKELNFRLVIFEDKIFGPRIVGNDLAKVFVAGVSHFPAKITLSKEENIFPLFGRCLIEEILRISFLPNSRGKIFLLRGEGITALNFVFLVKKWFPNLECSFGETNGDTQEILLPKKFKEIFVRENLEYQVEETAEWFERGRGREEAISESNQPVSSVPPVFSTEVVEDVQPKEEGKPDFICADSSEKLAEQSEREDAVSQNQNVNIAIQSFWEESKSEKKLKKVWGKGVLTFFIFILLLVSFFVLPLLLAIVSGVRGAKILDLAKTNCSEGKFDLALKNSEKAIKSLNSSERLLAVVSPFYSLFGGEKKVMALVEMANFSKQMGESTRSVVLALEEVARVGNNFINGENVDWVNAQSIIKTNFSFAYQQASLSQSSLGGAEKGFNLLGKKKIFEKIKASLPEYREKLLKGQELALMLPQIMGTDDRKTYLVLFQNNFELRPTGGFISAFGIANLENGKLINFEVHDIYQSDNELKGQVEPPAKIKEVLGEKIWYFRDANFDPEFSSSAGKALWFLDKEMHISADGVIAVNLFVLGDLLKALDGVEIAGYPERIKADNLGQKIMQYSEKGNLSQAKPEEEFIVALIKAIFEEVKLADPDKIIKIGGLVFSQLETKEMMLYSINNAVQAQITDLNWDGNLRQYQKKQPAYSTFGDYLFINEANLGINKANYFTKRKVEHEIKIDQQGVVQEKLLLTYENLSPSENWPAGKYKNYLRIYLPKNTKMTSALITDPNYNDIWLPFDPKSQEVFEEHEKTVLGFLFEIPAKSQVKLEVNYELSEKLDLKQKINSYLLLLQKQSGIYSDNYSLIFSYPESLVPLRVIPRAVVGEKRLLISESLRKDTVFQIDLAQ